MKRKTLLDVASIALLAIAVIIPQVYLQITQVNLTWTALFWAVIFPILLSLVLFVPRRRWILLLAFLAYIWALTDDAPVYFDSVFTWPEVTSGFQHFFLEILLHVLTFVFMASAVVVAWGKGRRVGVSRYRKIFASMILAVVAFILAYAQNLPFHAMELLVKKSWFELDVIEHIASVAFLFFAIRIAEEGPGQAGKVSPPEK
jgi:hypothetical protein